MRGAKLFTGLDVINNLSNFSPLSKLIKKLCFIFWLSINLIFSILELCNSEETNLNSMTKIQFYTPNLEAVYEKGVLFVKYCYYGVLQIVTSINF
jgi:hypothetical protein